MRGIAESIGRIGQMTIIRSIEKYDRVRRRPTLSVTTLSTAKYSVPETRHSPRIAAVASDHDIPGRCLLYTSPSPRD